MDSIPQKPRGGAFNRSGEIPERGGTREEMALRNILNYKKDGILRKKSRPVDKIGDRTRTLLDDMAETMYDGNGVGLAAPQVGVLRRLIVVDVGTGLYKLINPRIVEASGEQQGPEGCLSVPHIYGDVKRPESVKVRAVDPNGKTVRVEGTGLLARALCHEIDHLDGVLFLDKVVEGTLHFEEPSEESGEKQE